MRRLHQKLLVTALACAAPSCEAHGAVTLCRPTERVAFSCAAARQYVSLCASPNLSPGQGYLVYRHGRPGHLDLEYPSRDADRSKAYAGGILSFSGGGGAWLRLATPPYTYTVFTAVGKWAPGGALADIAGVAVRKGELDIAAVRCTAPATSELGPDLFQKAGVPEPPGADGFEIPDAFFPR